MPSGFNAPSIKGYLAKTWGLRPSSSDGVLLLTTTLEPPKRLASEVEAKAWLNGVVSVYAQRSRIFLTSPGAAGAGGGGGGGALINSEEFLKLQADHWLVSTTSFCISLRSFWLHSPTRSRPNMLTHVSSLILFCLPKKMI